MRILFLIVILCILMLGCDQSQKMLEPVAETILAPTPEISVEPKNKFDVNSDGVVDNTDLNIVSAAIGEDKPAYDFNDNGVVDGGDLILLDSNFSGVSQDPTEIAEDTLEIPVDFSHIEPPTIPESADITHLDHVAHYDDLSEAVALKNPHNFVFETARDAVSDDNIIGYFETLKAWAEEQCGGKNWGESPALAIFFTSREERDKFYDALPGGWDFWNRFDGVLVIGSKDVYYYSSLRPTDACKFADPN